MTVVGRDAEKRVQLGSGGRACIEKEKETQNLIKVKEKRAKWERKKKKGKMFTELKSHET